jgi:hypothetical protein
MEIYACNGEDEGNRFLRRIKYGRKDNIKNVWVLGFCSYIAEHSFFWNVTLRQRAWESDVSKQLNVLNIRSPNVRGLFSEIYTF